MKTLFNFHLNVKPIVHMLNRCWLALHVPVQNIQGPFLLDHFLNQAYNAGLVRQQCCLRNFALISPIRGSIRPWTTTHLPLPPWRWGLFNISDILHLLFFIWVCYAGSISSSDFSKNTGASLQWVPMVHPIICGRFYNAGVYTSYTVCVYGQGSLQLLPYAAMLL